MGRTFGAKAKAAIVAGSMALAVMPVTAFAAPQSQMGQFGQQPDQMRMEQLAEGQIDGEGMGQMNGQQPPAMPDGQQPPAGPMGQVREFIQKLINLLGIEVDQTALDEFFNGLGTQQPGTQQPGTQQTGAQQGEGTMGEARI